jgi:hypothetical protein
MENLMTDWDKIDVKPKKGKYTWTRRLGPGHIVARLYRFFVQIELLLDNLTLSSDIIPSSVSDHKPFALSFHRPQNLGPIPFRFNPL